MSEMMGKLEDKRLACTDFSPCYQNAVKCKLVVTFFTMNFSFVPIYLYSRGTVAAPRVMD